MHRFFFIPRYSGFPSHILILYLPQRFNAGEIFWSKHEVKFWAYNNHFGCVTNTHSCQACLAPPIFFSVSKMYEFYNVISCQDGVIKEASLKSVLWWLWNTVKRHILWLKNFVFLRIKLGISLWHQRCLLFSDLHVGFWHLAHSHWLLKSHYWVYILI